MIKKIIVDKNLNDGRSYLSKSGDPFGNRIDPDPDFDIVYRTADDKNELFIATPDTEFKTYADKKSFQGDKRYYVKLEGNAVPVLAKPTNCGLYEYTGLEYIPTRDEIFKENKEYFIPTANGYTKATPANVKLLQKQQPSTRNYQIMYKDRTNGTGEWTVTSANVHNFEELMAIFNKFKENRVAFKEGFNEILENQRNNPEAYKLTKQNSTRHPDLNALVDEITSGYGSARKGAVKATRASYTQQNIKRKAANRAAEIEHVIEKAPLELEKINEDRIADEKEPYTFRDLDPKENPNMDAEQRKAQKKVYMFNFDWLPSTNKYVLSSYGLRIPDTIYSEGIMNEWSFRQAWLSANTIEELFQDKVAVIIPLIQQVRDGAITPEQFFLIAKRSVPTTDSAKYMLYKIKDGKKLVIGVYDSVEEAKLADDGEKEKPIYKELGVYKDENDNKFIVKPVDANGRLVRLGKFDRLLTASECAIAFKEEANKDIEKFFETDFYNNHLNELKEVYNYFKENQPEGEREAEKGEPKIEKTPSGLYRIYYYANRKKNYIGRQFGSEASAQQIINKAIMSGDVDQFAREYNARYSDLQNLTTEKAGITRAKKITPQTGEDIKQSSLYLSKYFNDLNVDEVIAALSGQQNEFQFYEGLRAFIRKVLKRNGIEKKDIDNFLKNEAQVQSVQRMLADRVYEKVIKEAVDELVEKTQRDGRKVKLTLNSFVENILYAIHQKFPYLDKNEQNRLKELNKRIASYYAQYAEAVEEL